jgi:hypothetical protein
MVAIRIRRGSRGHPADERCVAKTGRCDVKLPAERGVSAVFALCSHGDRHRTRTQRKMSHVRSKMLPTKTPETAAVTSTIKSLRRACRPGT